MLFKNKPSPAVRLFGTALGILCFATPAAAKSDCAKPIRIAPEARLVTVAGETMVQFNGRGRLSGPLEIAGMTVDAGRGRSWRARVPLDDLRRNAAPFARRVSVATRCASARAGHVAAVQQVRLPIGLLGWNTQLASIELGMR